MIKYVFLALFLLTSVIHLASSWLDKPKHRMYTKPLLLVFLTLYYVFAADKHNYILIAALVTSWLGDVLLMPRGNKWFVIGGISFLISHLFFIWVYVPQIDFSAVKWLIVVPVAIVYYGISAAVMITLRKTTPKAMVVPMFLYLVANSTMNVFALMQLLTLKNTGAILAFIGAIMFFTSDCTLFIVRYHKNKSIIFKKHLTVMLTYLAGEFLITLGMLLIG